jgi:uncharacterized protein (DUF2235 family)
MALYAFDGTGNEDRPGEDKDSNVLDFFNGYQDPRKNHDPKQDRGSLYLKGIGQRARTFVGDKVAEAFGIGGHRRVRQALDRLENNIEAGDAVVDIVGFSRGAALAISFANEIAKKLPQVPIRFIGVWDIVGQFGLPGQHFNAGHDLDFPPNVAHCFHAMALDESRALFPLTRLGSGRNTSPKLQEVWFRGVHSDVGGGNGNRGLNWIALNWMFEAAVRSGLPIDPAAIAKNLQDRNRPQQISDHTIDAGFERKILAADLLHAGVQLTEGTKERPHNNPKTALARIDDAGRITEPV